MTTAKRLFDVVFCLLLIPIIGIPYIFIALTIKLSSKGPIHYLGIRTGMNATTFRIFKFRTMVVNAESAGGGTTALNDPRILPFGRGLRRFKLDELPQIFNVLRGEMSLVGPRPELPQYTSLYEGEEKLILSVKPGITDYSSIRFSSLDEIVGDQNADEQFERLVLGEKNTLRLKYVKDSSLFVDIKILFLTAWCVIKKIFN